jgi:predicted site-specific integrase-resolvase
MEDNVNKQETYETREYGPILAFPGPDGLLGRVVYVKEAVRFLGVTRMTLHRYVKAGKLVPYKSQINGRVFFAEADLLALLGSRLKQTKQVVLYCRSAVLGSRSDKGNSARERLAKQVQRMSDYCLAVGIRVDLCLTDVGPGTGSKDLEGYNILIEKVLRHEVSLVIVETPDRLARWGMGLVFEKFLGWHGVKLHVASPCLTREEYKEEIKQDLTEIIYESKRLLGEQV